jgi:CheY-like chemotaxis protein
MINAYKILIVEDSYSVGYLMAAALSRAGYLVMTAANGNEALHKISRFNPHCLLLDVVLPDISGFEVCRRLRTVDPRHMCRIILASSRNTPLDHRWGLRHGADYYLPKPFSQDTLMEIVNYIVSPEFRIPTTPQELIAAYQPPVKQELPDWNSFIPYRKEEPNIMTTTNPFIDPVAITDKRVRSVFEAIDNRRSVKHLSYITGLPMEDVLFSLQSLLDKDRVELHNAGGKLVDIKQFLVNR